MSVGRVIRPMERRDIGAAVAIHLAAFPGFFLSFLGPRFLRELYAAIIEDPSGIAFVEEGAGAIRGFVAGTAEPSGFYGRILRKRWWRFALAAVPAFVERPAIAPRLLRALGMPGRTVAVPGRGTLMSLAVDPAEQRGGTGATLVRRFLTAARDRTLREIDLTTDVDENEPVHRFYEKLGFRMSREFVTPEGRKMREYVTEL